MIKLLTKKLTAIIFRVKTFSKVQLTVNIKKLKMLK